MVDDLDSDGLFDLLLLRTDADGATLAEHFRWREGELRSGSPCRLSCTAGGAEPWQHRLRQAG